ncbi:delta(3,5)-Delta(2,4)-dienoyl-CoA isomerase, peroxisomal [Telopea speciosissima]|uniref:delta(3,5)-Delta(2,4)-dienoyl-CoA isomerase, peroxisomal n=1 Tax=Telopea speciosissima TaxID=54955 RepID=UPI001CC813C5|nr:delta(3,5)-Delta(2,4)-dienoyl-CoA isomerase, peroxisomal [Telopea speciosissima]
MEKYKTLEIVRASSNSQVINLYLNRQSVRNALSSDFFSEFPRALSSLDQDPNVRVIILSGHGDHFCAGIDLSTLKDSFANTTSNDDRGRSGERIRQSIKGLQAAITALERCRKPVIAGIHGGCIGGGIDLVTGCDIRYCTEDSFFSVKEVDLAIVADLGTLQRLPGIVGFGNAMELALTGRKFSGLEAKSFGLVSRVFGSKSAMDEGLVGLAEGIAEKSPLAVNGTKAVLLRSRDLTLDQGLDYVATWNSVVLQSNDLAEAVSAQIQKRKPVFAKL